MAPASTFKRAEALPEAIANHIAQAIAARELADGERIVETALAAELGVSRVPVREALKILATQGIIDGGGHRGYKVVTFSQQTVASVHEARFAVETLFTREAIAAWREGRSDLTLLDAGIEAMARAARNGDTTEMLEADVAFHTLICEAAQNPIYMTLWTAIARHVLIILNLARFRDVDLWVVVRRHEAFRDRLKDAVAGDLSADQIRDILRDHILPERRGYGVAGAHALDLDAEPLGGPGGTAGTTLAASADSGKGAGAGAAPTRRATRRRPSGTSRS